jgi:hypothetical protein
VIEATRLESLKGIRRARTIPALDSGQDSLGAGNPAVSMGIFSRSKVFFRTLSLVLGSRLR